MSALARTTLAILGGGAGSRLGGAAKGLIQVSGRACLAHLAALAPRFADALVVSSEPRYAPFGLRLVPDPPGPLRGPVAGLLSALRHAAVPEVLLVACDMPFLSLPALALLAEAPGRAVAFERAGRLEPLPCLLRASPDEVAGLGEHSLKGVLAGLGVAGVAEARLREVDPQLRTLVSLNTPEDLARWGATLP